MKKILPLMVFCLFYLTGTAQQNFQRIYGGAGNERGHAITMTLDGGYAIAGQTNSFGAGDQDIFVLKVDSMGTLIWQRTYGSILTDMGYSIAIMETPDSGLVVTGTGSGEGTRILDLYLFKTDAHGTLLWDYQYDSGDELFNSGDHGRGLLYTRDGDILIFGTDDADSFGSNDGLIIKTDANGNLLWKNVYGDNSNDHLLDAIELSGGNVLVCGSSGSFGPGNTAAYLVKVDPAGNLLWANAYGGNGIEFFHGCDKASDHGIIATGATTSYGAGQYDILLTRIDSLGIPLWTKTFGGSGDDWGVSVKTLDMGSGYLVLAFTDSYGNGDNDILVVRTDSNGEIIWARTFGTQGVERVDTWAHDGLALTPDNGFVLTCWSDSLSVAGEDVIFIKSDIEGSIFCDDVSLVMTSPDISTVVTETNVASPGIYGPAPIIVTNSAFVGSTVCYCTPDCEICELTVIHYDLDACYSHTGNGSDMDYSEFTPEYMTTLSYAKITASGVHRSDAAINKHSCTPGIEGTPAMCVSSLNACVYDAGNSQSVVFEMTIVPDPDSSVQVATLSFYQKAPEMFQWIGGASGLNNYPTLYGIRVLRNGAEIFRQEGISTSLNTWSLESYSFLQDSLFVARDSTTFRFELLAYCLIGNGATVTAWDLDELSISVSCDPVTDGSQNITGYVRNEAGIPLEHVAILLSDDPDANPYFAQSTTDHFGQYFFHHVSFNDTLYLKGFNNSNFLNGVSTLDLIHIQKHLLGLQPFVSPYQMIAADANRSNSVSALDMYLLRALILGRITELPNNTSWRFAVSDQDLPLPQPWDFKETIGIQNVGVDIGNAHFLGIKTGDVNNDARTSLDADLRSSRATGALTLSMIDQDVTAYQPLKIDIKSTDFQNISGFQFALKLDGMQFENILSGKIEISDANMNYTQDGTLYVSWSQAESLSAHHDEVLFSLLVLPEQNGSLSQFVEIDYSKLNVQAYQGVDLNVISLDLQIAMDPISDKDNLLQNAPNPFSSSTTIRFRLQSENSVEFRFYDVSGQLLKIHQGFFESGLHEISVSRADLGVNSGIIFCQMTTTGFAAVRKMVLLQ